MADVKLNVITSIPVQLSGRSGVSVVRNGGIYTVNLDFSTFPVAAPPVGSLTVIFDSSTGETFLGSAAQFFHYVPTYHVYGF